MKLPTKFVYMNHPFKIVERKPSKDSETKRRNWGEVRWKDQRIIINPTLKPDIHKAVFAHELWHIALDRSGLSLDHDSLEKLIDVISHGMIEMFKSNEWFGEYFHGKSRR